MSKHSRTLSWIVVVCIGIFVVGYLLVAATPAADPNKDFHLQGFGQLPVLDHGRVKPMDTLARISLMSLSGRQVYYIKKTEYPAVKWLLEVMSSDYKNPPPNADGTLATPSGKELAYRVDNEMARKLLKLKGSPSEMLSYNDIATAAGKEGVEAFIQYAIDLQKNKEDVGTDDRAVTELALQMRAHQEFSSHETGLMVFRIDSPEVLALLNLEPREGFRYSFSEIVPRASLLYREAQRADEIKARDRSVYDVKVIEVARKVELYVGLARGNSKTLHLVAPAGPGDEWKTFPLAQRAFRMARGENENTLRQHTPVVALELMFQSYAKNDPERFNLAVQKYHELLEKVMPGEVATASTETGFNAFAPFYQCMVMYLIVFVMVAVYWLWREQPLLWFAFGLTVLTVLIHSWALLARMYIQGRPPVTNLYSSAVFIGWGSVLFCVVLELFYRKGLGLAVASVTGFLTLLMAHHLAGSGDTLEMMQAVLDTNFWLATHVTTVTLGYAATFVAGLFGIIALGFVLLTSVGTLFGIQPDNTTHHSTLKILGQCIYGIVCFGMLFSFVGTVLGGIWADQSWGRFWGWDPKENGALLIVIMNALILHARWGGMIKERGMAILAMFGNMVTMWSWFGTNQLGIGLHAYGFNNTLVVTCTIFWICQLLLIGLALLPLSAWYPKYPIAAVTPVVVPVAVEPEERVSGKRRRNR